jgi:hypothetical protein
MTVGHADTVLSPGHLGLQAPAALGLPHHLPVDLALGSAVQCTLVLEVKRELRREAFLLRVGALH